MYNVSNAWKTEVIASGREYDAYVIINGITYSSQDIISISYSHGVLGDKFEIGNVPSAYVEIKLNQVIDVDEVIVQPYAGMYVNDVVEYVPLGIFKVEETFISNKITTLRCYDRMVELETSYTSTETNISGILSHIFGSYSYNVPITTHVSSLTFPVMKNRKKREVLSFVATLLGGIIIVDRQGTFKLKRFSESPNTDYVMAYNGDSYYKMNYQPTPLRIGKVQISDGKTTYSNTVNASYATLKCTSPLVKTSSGISTTVAELMGYLDNLKMYSYVCEVFGNPSLDICDSIWISPYLDDETTDSIYTHIGSIQHTYNGYWNTVLSNVGNGKIKQDYYADNQYDIKEDMASILTDVSTALTTAELASQYANQAQASANGKSMIYYGTDAPTGTFNTNDVWFDTNDGHKPYRWNGTAWTAAPFGMNALGELTANSITTGTLDASKVTINNLSANTIKAGFISTVDWESNGALATSHLRLYKDVLSVYDGNNEKVRLAIDNISGTYIPSLKLGDTGPLMIIKNTSAATITYRSGVWPSIFMNNAGIDLSGTITHNGDLLTDLFAAKTHSHTEYSLTSHSHSNYSLTSHTHDYLPNGGGTLSGALGTQVIYPDVAAGSSGYSIGYSNYRYNYVYCVTLSQSSDKNMKEMIQPIDDRLISVMDHIDWRQYQFINGEPKTHIGVIAQDVASKFEDEGLDPDDYSIYLKTTTDDGHIDYAINYINLLGLQAEAFKRKLSSLEQRILQLEGVR